MTKLNRRRSGSIRNQILWTFVLLLILEALVFGLLSNYLFQRTLSQTNEAYMSQFVLHLRQVTDTYISYLEDISEVATHNPDIKDFFIGENISEEQKVQISDYLNSVKNTRGDITSIILIDPHGNFVSDTANDVFSSYEEMKKNSWFDAFRQSPEKQIYITPSHVQSLIDGEYPWVISLIKKIGDGYIIVDLNYSLIEELCSSIDIGQKGYVFIVNEHGEMVYHPRLDLIYSGLKNEKTEELIQSSRGSLQTTVDNQRVLYTFESSDLTGWTIVSVGYIKDLFSSLREFFFLMWLILIISVSVAVFFSLIISTRITRPIEVLQGSMKEVEKGNFDIEIDVDCDHEVYDLAIDCTIAIKKIRDLIEEGVRDQEAKRKHELKALQAQINPHFLYNTLDSIIWLTESNLNDDAISMTEQLANFFRLSLSRGKELISVRHVYQHLESYLIIQKMRYKNTLNYQIKFEEGILDYSTIKFILQPIVENALYHGLKNRKGIGHIWIKGNQVEQDLLFSVEDDGIGMDPELQKLLNSGDFSHFSRSGVGLRNVSERIKLTFGQEYGIQFHSREEGGTIALITLPMNISQEPT